MTAPVTIGDAELRTIRDDFEEQFVKDGWPECILARRSDGEYIFDGVTRRLSTFIDQRLARRTGEMQA
jgi:hypothetical protein